MKKRLPLLIALITFPFLAFACGPCAKEETPKEGIQSSTEEALLAGAEGDWEGFCQQLTENSQNNLISLLRVKEGTTCAEALKKREDLVGERVRAQARDTKIEKVRASGKDKGSVQVKTSMGIQIYNASLEGDSWKVNLFP